MRASVVIANHNGRRFVPACLDAVAKTRLAPGDSLEVIVVDNGSTDGSAKLLAARPDVVSIVSEEALGFGGANNCAREVATGDVICFLNNDTVVDPDWLLRPLEILKRDPQVGAVGSKLVYMHPFVEIVFHVDGVALVTDQVYGSAMMAKSHWVDAPQSYYAPREERVRELRTGSRLYIPLPLEGLDGPETPTLRVVHGANLRLLAGGKVIRGPAKLPGIIALDGLEAVKTKRVIQNAGSFLTEFGEGGDFGAGALDDAPEFNSEEVVPALCGAAFIARLEALEAVGWFPKHYFVYYEDTDLSLALRSLGWKLVFCPQSRVNHYHTGTNRETSSFFVENVAKSSLVFSTRYVPVRRLLPQLKRHLGSAARDLLSYPSFNEAWRRSARLRGTVRALPTAMACTAERALKMFGGDRKVLGSAFLDLNRHPYRPIGSSPGV